MLIQFCRAKLNIFCYIDNVNTPSATKCMFMYTIVVYIN